MFKRTRTKRLFSLVLACSLMTSMLAGCNSQSSPSSSQSGSSIAPSSSSQSSSSDVVAKTANGGVSSSTSYSTQIGIDILKAGGNAIDAAVAVAFAIGVAEPEMSGVGGCGIMNVYLKDSNEYKILEFMESTPKDFVPGVFDPKDQKMANSGMNAAVPSQVNGLLTALEKYGTMDRKDVMAPAIKLANEGYTLDKNLHYYIGLSYDRIINNPELKSIYTDDGIPRNVGDKITNPNLAKTLQAISDGGKDEFYKGETAKKIVEGLRAGGSPITMEDMAVYETIEREPLVTNYYGYDIVSPPPPASGGMWLQQALNILEEKNIKDVEPNSKEYLHLVTDATRLAFMDSQTYIGDPAYFELPDKTIVSKEYGKERAKMIMDDKAIPEVKAGDLPTSRREATATEGKHTSHISVIDQYGNIVSLTTTLGNLFGCATAIDGMGFSFNSHMSNIEHDPAKSQSPDYVMPGKRVRTTIAPTIVVKEGNPILAIGSPGSYAIPPAITLVTNNILLYGMGVQEAIDFPRATSTDMGKATIYAEENSMTPEVREALTQMGYTINPSDDMITSGCIAAVYVDSQTGAISAGADQRRGYVAQTY